MDAELVPARKAKLESEASETLLKLIRKFEADTGIEVRGGTVSGLGWHPGSDGRSLEREVITIRFELETF